MWPVKRFKQHGPDTPATGTTGVLARPDDPPDAIMGRCSYPGCHSTVWLHPYPSARVMECASCHRPWYRDRDA